MRNTKSWLARSIAAAAAIATSIAPVRTALAASPSPIPGNLNLASAHRTYVEPQGIAPTRILVGGRPLTVSSGMAVTPAEAAAVLQVLTSGIQSLTLTSSGKAAGGSFTLPSAAAVS